jgi:hypothetical protein
MDEDTFRMHARHHNVIKILGRQFQEKPEAESECECGRYMDVTPERRRKLLAEEAGDLEHPVLAPALLRHLK